MLPQVKNQIKKVSTILFACTVPILAIGAIFFQDANKGYLFSNFSGEIYAIILVGALLFTITVPLGKTKIRNINNLFVGAISILVLIVMYFFASSSGSPVDTLTNTGIIYADPIILTGQEAVSAKFFEYSTPIRINVDSQGMAFFTEIALYAFIIVLLQIFLRLAMGKTSFQSFWKYWHIAFFAAIAWSSLFYSIGVPMWKIIAIIAVSIISAPNVMHIISTYIIGEHRDDAISKWEG